MISTNDDPSKDPALLALITAILIQRYTGEHEIRNKIKLA